MGVPKIEDQHVIVSDREVAKRPLKRWELVD